MGGYEGETQPLRPLMRRCQRCGGLLQKGFLPDVNHSTIRVRVWAEGEPEYTRWNDIRASGRWIPIVAWRCIACGGIDLFAIEE